MHICMYAFMYVMHMSINDVQFKMSKASCSGVFPVGRLHTPSGFCCAHSRNLQAAALPALMM